MNTRLISTLLACTTLTCVSLAACAIGPTYKTPTAPVPQGYVSEQGWTPATPADGLDKGAWWQLYNDPVLDGLERKVVLSNQNVAAAEALFRQTAALVDEDRASLWPSLGLSFGATRSGGSATNAQGITQSTGNRFSAAASASWAIDVWGKVRREIEQSKAQSEGAKADLANAVLTAQATLAIDYFTLRALDEQQALVAQTVENYQHALTLTQNQYKQGVAQRSDVLSAQSQLQTTQASLSDLSIQRGQMLHAIATLTGVAPDGVDLPAGKLTDAVPVASTGVPSELLQRRPDIAAAERSVAAANAAVGISETAFFPTLSLSASDSSSNANLSKLFSAHTSTWSTGANIADTLIEFGARSAAVKASKASYDEQVAKYRQTVLEAFQNTEDNLLSLRVLEGEQTLREQAADNARQAEAITLNQYKAGRVAYSTVITAQNATLSAEISTLSLKKSRLIASASLVEDLGGGWTADALKAR